MLKVNNLSTKFLKGVSFEVKKGDVFNVVGPNGAGKSTLGKSLVGLEKLNSGEIVMDDKNIHNLSTEKRAKKGLIYVFQNIPVYSHVTVEGYFKVFLGENSIPVNLFKKLGLDYEEYKDRRFDDKLSGGERKKIEMLLNLSLPGSIYILDEVDSGLDYFSVDALKNIIKEQNKAGKTFIIISHNKHFQQICNRGLVLCDGRVKEEGDIDIILEYYNKRCFGCSDLECKK